MLDLGHRISATYLHVFPGWQMFRLADIVRAQYLYQLHPAMWIKFWHILHALVKYVPK